MELLNHYQERQPFQDDLKRYQIEYWAKPSSERQTYPWLGAANVIVPLIAISVESMHARNMQTLFALDQFVSCKAINPDWEEYERPVERALDHELMNSIKIRKPCDYTLLEIEKFGSGLMKVGYERIIKRAIVDNPDGTSSPVDVVVKDGPAVDSCSLGRFLMPYSDLDPQLAKWVGEEHSATPYEIMLKENSGFFKKGTFEILRKWVVRSAVGTLGVERRFQRTQEVLEHRAAQWPKYIDWNEIWMSWDVNEDGIEEEVVLHYHRASETIMSCRYNWFADVHRPYRIGVYFPVEHRWAGIGLCKQLDSFQKEITTQHRQRIDNATLANMRMIKVSRLSGYGKNEPMFPGKIWFLDDMTHVDSFQMGEIYPSSFNNEQATLQYAQQRSGINELNTGQPQAGTPGTATDIMARIQEGNKKFDYIYENIKTMISEVVMDVACVWQQFGPRSVKYYDNAEDGKKVQKFFSMPSDLIRNNFLLQIKAAGQQTNKILDRQNWQSVAVIYQQYITGLIQLAQAAGDKQLEQMIIQYAFSGSTEAMMQILETYDIRNIDRIIPKVLLQAAKSKTNGLITSGNGNGEQPPTAPAGGLPILGGNTGSPGTSPIPSVGTPAAIAALAGARGTGPTDLVPGAV
jgi:hypothetical protein